jgi:hypothetical protein
VGLLLIPGTASGAKQSVDQPPNSRKASGVLGFLGRNDQGAGAIPFFDCDLRTSDKTNQKSSTSESFLYSFPVSRKVKKNLMSPGIDLQHGRIHVDLRRPREPEQIQLFQRVRSLA